MKIKLEHLEFSDGEQSYRLAEDAKAAVRCWDQYGNPYWVNPTNISFWLKRAIISELERITMLLKDDLGELKP